MTGNEYTVARETLGWTHMKIAKTIGISRRTAYRAAAGEPVPESVARCLRLLVLMRLSVSERKFDQIVRQLQ